jgi:putative DNA primase/helicase
LRCGGAASSGACAMDNDSHHYNSGADESKPRSGNGVLVPGVSIPDIAVTFFSNLAATVKREEIAPFDELARLIRDITAPTKGALPLMVFARFGDKMTDQNCLRWDGNVAAISGILVDYDREEISIAEAVARLTEADVSAIVYSSPSHTPERPRWRVGCPLSQETGLDAHYRLVSRLNGVLGGVLARESWTGSQSYYLGSVNSNPAHQVEIVAGVRTIDQADDLDAIARGKPNGDAGEHVAGEPEAAIGDIRAALEAIPNPIPEWDDPNHTWVEWNNIGLAVWRAAGGSEEGLAEWHKWSRKSPRYSHDETEFRWNHYFRAPPGKIGFGTLAYLAKQQDPDWIQPSKIDLLDPNNPRRIARIFVQCCKRTLRCHAGDIYEWRGSHYHRLDGDDVRAELYRFLETKRRPVKVKKDEWGSAPFAPNKSKVDNILDALKALVHVASEIVPPAWLEPVQETGAIMACRNGLARLLDGNYIPHSPDYFNTAAARFDYDPLAGPPVEWLKFLASLWPGDQPSIDTLQEICGYIISGDNSLHKMFLLIGPPRSGKGTIGRILVNILGGMGHVGVALANLGETFGLQPLLDKMLGIVPDARLSGRSHVLVERLLAIFGADDLTVARKNTTSVTVRLPTRFVFLTNVLPALADSSGTIASRFVVLTMAISFLGREDRELEARLTRELPAILNWAIEGWRRLMKRGRFVQPESGRATQVNLSYLASPVKQFVEENYKLGPDLEIETELLYSRWVEWCEDNGEGHPGSQTSFGMKLAAAFQFAKKERYDRSGNGEPIRHYVYVGIGFPPGDSLLNF